MKIDGKKIEALSLAEEVCWAKASGIFRAEVFDIWGLGLVNVGAGSGFGFQMEIDKKQEAVFLAEKMCMAKVSGCIVLRD